MVKVCTIVFLVAATAYVLWQMSPPPPGTPADEDDVCVGM
jgi:hypothetical protein